MNIVHPPAAAQEAIGIFGALMAGDLLFKAAAKRSNRNVVILVCAVATIALAGIAILFWQKKSSDGLGIAACIIGGVAYLFVIFLVYKLSRLYTANELEQRQEEVERREEVVVQEEEAAAQEIHTDAEEIHADTTAITVDVNALKQEVEDLKKALVDQKNLQEWSRNHTMSEAALTRLLATHSEIVTPVMQQVAEEMTGVMAHVPLEADDPAAHTMTLQ